MRRGGKKKKRGRLFTTDRSDTASFSCAYLCEIGNPPSPGITPTGGTAAGIIVARPERNIYNLGYAHTEEESSTLCWK